MGQITPTYLSGVRRLCGVSNKVSEPPMRVYDLKIWGGGGVMWPTLFSWGVGPHLEVWSVGRHGHQFPISNPLSHMARVSRCLCKLIHCLGENGVIYVIACK